MVPLIETASSTRRRDRGAVAAAFTLLATANVFGFFLMPIALEAHVAAGTADPSVVASATGVFALAAGAATPIVSRLLGRISPRWIALGSSMLAAVAILVLGTAQSVPMLVAGFVLQGAAMVGCGPLLYTTYMVQRFPAAPDRPVGIVMSGLSLGGLVFSPIFSIAVSTYGFAAVAPFAAAFHLLLIGIPSAVLLRPAPETAPFTATEAAPTETGPLDIPPAVPVAIATPRRPLRMLVLVCAAAILILVIQGPVNTQLIALAQERAPAVAHAVVAVMAGSAFLFRMAVVVFLPRIRPRPLLVASAVVQAVGIAALAFAHDPVVLLLGIMAMGFAIGNAPAALPVLVLDRFGSPRYARTYAVVSAVMAVTSAVGAAAFGAFAQATASFVPALLVTAALAAVALVPLFALGSQPRPATTVVERET